MIKIYQSFGADKVVKSKKMLFAAAQALIAPYRDNSAYKRYVAERNLDESHISNHLDLLNCT